MTRALILSILAAAVSAAPAFASTPGSYAVLDRQTTAACAKASGLPDASVGPVVRFSDRFAMDARTVTGTYPQPHMKGAKGTMLCLYDRRTRRAEVQEMAPAIQIGASSEIKDIVWRGTEIDGRPVGSSPVTLMFGSDGKVTGKSACNNYSANYMLTGSTLIVYSGMIGTRMACPENVMAQEMQFRTILAAARSATLDSDGRMTLTAANGRSVRFVRAQASTN
jgi:heat shock protein HslJ